MTTQTPVFAPISLSFMFLVALMYSALIMGAVWANNRVSPQNQWSIRALRFFTGGFLLFVGLLALDGFFFDFTVTPPKLVYAILPALAGVLLLAFHPLILRWIREIPQRWLIGLQSFRVIVEIQLFFLAQVSLVSQAITWQGRNFDIVIGVTAPIVAWFVHRAHKQKKSAVKIVIAWNLLGLISLGNAGVQGFMNFSESLGLGHFPYVWLTSFLAPFALLLHILSLKREWSFYKNPGYKARAMEATQGLN